MEKSLKTGFAKIFSCYPKSLSCPKFGGAAAPPRPPGPYAYVSVATYFLYFIARIAQTPSLYFVNITKVKPS